MNNLPPTVDGGCEEPSASVIGSASGDGMHQEGDEGRQGYEERKRTKTITYDALTFWSRWKHVKNIYEDSIVEGHHEDMDDVDNAVPDNCLLGAANWMLTLLGQASV